MLCSNAHLLRLLERRREVCLIDVSVCGQDDPLYKPAGVHDAEANTVLLFEHLHGGNPIAETFFRLVSQI